jgi:hypothetical protein
VPNIVWNENFSKVGTGTGTATNHYGSITLVLSMQIIHTGPQNAHFRKIS